MAEYQSKENGLAALDESAVIKKAAEATDTAVIKDSDAPSLPAFANYKNGAAVFCYSLSSALIGGLASNCGAIYFVSTLEMSAIWMANVTIICLIIGLPVAIAVAQIGDTLESKYGRRKPFILAAAPLACISALLVGLAPTDISGSKNELNVIFLVLMIFSTLAGAIAGTPFKSWMVESSRDPDDYSNIATVSFIGVAIGATMGGVVTNVPEAIPVFSKVSSIMLLLSVIFLLCAVPSQVLSETPKLPPLVPSFRTCIRTKEFRMIFANETLLQIAGTGVSAILFNIFYTCFNFQHTTDVREPSMWPSLY